MIKATELRLGNLINHITFGVVSAKLISDDYVQCEYKENVYFEDLEHYEPIPLTEEWLLKFGFKYDKVLPFLLCKGAFNINTGNHNIWHYGHKAITSPKYVHQLQNLYFALTGVELEVKDE